MKDYFLSDIAEIIDCEHKTAPKVGMSEYYSIRTTDIFNGKIAFQSANRVSEETYIEWTKRGTPETGDIILAREAPVGETGWVKEGYKVCLGQRTVLIKVTHQEISNRFLLYYLVNPDTKDELQLRSVGSVVAHLNMKDIRAFKISLPLLPEQKAIAAVLSSLDDKIDLLHRQNKTLEAMAETLFRQWFVEEAGDWEDELGKLPIEIIDGDRGINYPKNTEFSFHEYCLFLNAQNVTSNGFSFNTCSFITKEKDEILRNGKLMRNDIVLTTRGTVGNIALYHNLIPFDNIRINSGMVILRANTPEFPALYLYIVMKSKLFSQLVDEHISGSAQPQLPIRDIKIMKLIKPPKNKLDEFIRKAKPIYDKIFTNQNQIKTLETLRDTLLPKLMTGEVRVTP